MKKTEPAKLNLREYWNEVGTENVRKIIDRLESSMAYARLLKYGLKKPGHGFALRFIDAARELTPGWEPNLELMLRGVPKANNGLGGRITPPSPKFVKSQQKVRQQQATEAA